MNLRGIGEGDIVRLRDDATLWVITRRQGQRLSLRLSRGPATRNTTAHELVAAWKRVQRKGPMPT